MKILLIVLALVIVTPFLFGVVLAALKGSKKKRRAHAIVLLSSLSRGAHTGLKEIWRAHQASNTSRVNILAGALQPQVLKEIVEVLRLENRPPHSSSGKAGDVMLSVSLRTELNDQGYSNDAGKIIAGIITHDLDKAL